MINSWAVAAQAMINKNADYRAGDGARPARALGPTPARCRRDGTGAAAPRRTASPSIGLGPTDGLASVLRQSVVGWAELGEAQRLPRGRSYSLWSNRDFGFRNRFDPVPPDKRWRSCSPAANGGGPRGKMPPPRQTPAPAYADSRDGPALRAALHRPGATRHPWRDAPFCGHPDRAPPPVTPPRGPTDGLEFCG
jgi:hypothetical protein